LAASSTFDLLPALGELDIPTLIVHGDHDLVPIGVARDIAAAMPRSTLVVLDDCGHFAYLEQAERVHGHVSRFLAGDRGSV
jgi:proline iminopeptidase